ncbi:MAG: CocE/NonD family hydrolase [Candidatus Aminicenantes bacterium]|nr:CocE/NonD family hydrolase [Candidatus Aminicenantes bacterium]
MSKHFKNIQLFSFLFLLCILLAFINPASVLSANNEERVSEFGHYHGYSEDIYDSWIRTSLYVSMRDGVKLAVDIIRPVKNGEIEQAPLPLVWTHNRYRRAFLDQGKVIDMTRSSYVRALLKRGYIIGVVDVRGAGASFGRSTGVFTKEETQDAYEITEWFAAQPWCDGNIGMFGGSYLGITQIMAASKKPPHLKAIFPMVALFDLYEFSIPGGVFRDDFIRTWGALTWQLDTQDIAAPVDMDTDQALLKAAVAEHQHNIRLFESMNSLRFRDSLHEETGAYPYKEWHPAGYIQEINESKIPMYLWCGWLDSFTRDGFQMYRNFNNPRKIVMGAWSHSPKDPDVKAMEYPIYTLEQIRWFDYWLKGIDNGIMNEAPIHYQVINTPKDFKWKTSSQWPLRNEKPTPYYFNTGLSESISSINDGRLTTTLPINKEGKDDYKVDFSFTTGTSTRWDNATGGEFEYPDMTANDQKALTYTTAPLDTDLEITGHPVVHLWASSTATDGSFFAYLEEIDSQDFSHYLTEGTLRASYRSLNDPPYDTLGLPYHRGFKEDIQELIPGTPVKLVFDLHPISNVFNKGNRLRVTIACADKDNAETIEQSPPPTVTIYRNADKASYILLPVIQALTDTPARPGVDISLFYIVLIVIVVVFFTIILTLYLRKRSKV